MDDTYSHALTAFSILLLMCLAGSFGGILDVLQLIEVRKLIEQEGPLVVSKKRFIAALVLGAVGGIGGAMSMLFVITATAKLDVGDKPENLLLLFTLGVVSGFLGYRVLRSIAMRVEKQIQEAELRTNKRIKAVERRSQEYSRLIDAISMGRTIATDASTPHSVNEETIASLEELRKRRPDHRDLNMVLGRLYKKQKNYQRAIEVLTQTLQAMRIKPTGRDKDIADVLYNRACYYNIMADDLREEAEKRELKEKAYADLEVSVRLSPANKTDAAEDGDFSSLRDEERFKNLTRVYP